MVTTEWSDWRNSFFWWLQSVYVIERARQRGVFRALYSHVESLMKSETGVCGIRLCVERENERAQRTYASVGMSDSRYVVMEVDRSGAVGNDADAH
jgi:ribosomal protein S18 acetylase RimI-like enzyme